MTGLARNLSLMGLAATGICSMVGAGINIIPIMIQRNVAGIGPHVLPAYALAVVPALLAAFAYAILASGMPRAGGSYVYASRALHPFLGFAASFSQWFGLSIAIGVVAYVLVPFLRDIAAALGWETGAGFLSLEGVRLVLALGFLWVFTGINCWGLRIYERTLIPLMFFMFMGGLVVVFSGFRFDHTDFAAALWVKEGTPLTPAPVMPLQWGKLLAASAILFSSFIGFDSIAQAGGEARNPSRTLPLAIGIAVAAVATFYLLFTAAVYHAVPWHFIAERAQGMDLTAPGLLGYLLPPAWTVAIVAGAAIALINDLPAMLLAVSRLMFAWAEDGIFPAFLVRVHPRWKTPHWAILVSSLMASLGIVGSHLAGDFFLGVDLLVISMLVNFCLMSLAVLSLPRRNPRLAAEIRFFPQRKGQLLVGGAGVCILGLFLLIHILKDLSAPAQGWYFHSTWVWLLVMALASLVFWGYWRRLRRRGIDPERIFAELPPE